MSDFFHPSIKYITLFSSLLINFLPFLTFTPLFPSFLASHFLFAVIVFTWKKTKQSNQKTKLNLFPFSHSVTLIIFSNYIPNFVAVAAKILAPTFKSFSLQGDSFIASEKHSWRRYAREDKEISEIPNVHSLGNSENTETGFLSDSIHMESAKDSTGVIWPRSIAEEVTCSISSAK